MNSELTIAFIVDNHVREELLLKNPIFNNSLINKKIFFLENYKPNKYSGNYIKSSQENFIETIRENLETNFSIILKPEEQIQFFLPFANIENDAYVNIEFIKNTSNSFENSNIFEKRLILKKPLNNENIFLDNIILSSFFYNSKELINCLYDKVSERFAKNKHTITDILFLSELGYLEDTNNYSYLLDDDSINKKDKVQLVLEIVKKYYRKMDLKEAKEILDKGLNIEKNSININYFYGEIQNAYSKSENAIYYYNKCIELFENKNYYKEENIPKALKGYLIYYALGLSYKKLKRYKEAHESFKKSLEINPNFKQAQEKIKETVEIAKKEIYFPYDHKKELMFSCQSCGNCCRSFDVNITDYDIGRILENRPDLKFDDFIEIVKPLAKTDVDNLKLPDGKEAMIILKQKPNSKECIFLTEDNKCSIHDFKPIGCRTWPFSLNIYNSDVKWNNLFRPFLKNKCAHKLIENSNDENFLRENLEKLIDDVNLYKLKVKEWNKKNLNKLTKDDLIKYLLPNKNDESLYNDVINYFKNQKEVKLIVDAPLYSIYENKFREGYKFIEIISSSDDVNIISSYENLMKLKNQLNIDFIYYTRFPVSVFKLYRNGNLLNLYFSEIENYKLFDKSEIIYKNNIENNFEKYSYIYLLNEEIHKFKIKFENKKSEASRLISIKNFEKSNSVITSMVWDIALPLLYLINRKVFHPETISTLKKAPNNIFVFINEFEKYEKNELSQKGLYFITVNIIEEIFQIVNTSNFSEDYKI